MLHEKRQLLEHQMKLHYQSDTILEGMDIKTKKDVEHGYDESDQVQRPV